jgi:predicted hotdog family 3-hydroxylacyl-ACP dehydratase
MTLPADTQAYMLHRPPLRLVQSLLRVEDDYAEAQTALNPGDVGVAPDGRLEAAVLLELVAQTYAASRGYQDRDSGTPGELGYLVGASNFHVEQRPRAGQQLLIKIQSSCSFESFYLVDGQVLCEGRVVAGGTLKVWVQPGAGQQAAQG